MVGVLAKFRGTLVSLQVSKERDLQMVAIFLGFLTNDRKGGLKNTS